MKSNFSDNLKDVLPSLDLGSSIEPSVRIDPSIFEPVSLGDPDNFAPNRTANSAERIVEMLEKQEASNKRESIKTTIILIISGLTLIATLIGVFR